MQKFVQTGFSYNLPFSKDSSVMTRCYRSAVMEPALIVVCVAPAFAHLRFHESVHRSLPSNMCAGYPVLAINPISSVL